LSRADERLDEHLDDGALVELALGDGEAVGGAHASGCALCGARLAELRGFLDTCRDVALEDAPERSPSAGFVAGVLARTTREDPSWRGDLRLVGAFLRGRFRASRAVRFAAASLLVHLLVLPVFAWMALREVRRERVIRVSVLPAEEQALPAVPKEPEPDPTRMVGGEAADAGARLPEPRLLEGAVAARTPDPAEVARVVLRDRAFLRFAAPRATSTTPPVAAEPPPTVLEQLLAARTAVLQGRSADDLPAAAAGLERAVLAEVLLDRWLFDSLPSPRLDAVLRALGRDPAVPAAERRLELFSLQRARGYGLLGAEALERLAGLERAVEPLPVPADGTPWAVWAEGLEGALAGREEARRAGVTAWTRWQR